MLIYLGCGQVVWVKSNYNSSPNQLGQELRWKQKERTKGVKVNLNHKGPGNEGDQGQLDQASQDAGNKGDRASQDPNNERDRASQNLSKGS